MKNNKNLQHIFVETLRKIEEEGTEVIARGQKQKEIIGYKTNISLATQRVIIHPLRKNNIFAQLAETLWVINGRNDLDFLSWYLPRAVDFSDDGKTWRAAYGPRIRSWKGETDQLHQIISRFKQDINTKRAVISIYDPGEDFADSKDIPCNNWLHFIQRNGKLHLNVAVRANDVIWGFTGINFFEWSVLLEIISKSLNLEVGEINWFVGSMHVYERHYKRASDINKGPEYKTLYEYKIPTVPISSNLNSFDKETNKIFQHEYNYRKGNFKDLSKEIEDNFLKEVDKMLRLYAMHQHSVKFEYIAEAIQEICFSDLRVAAVEYLGRYYGQDWVDSINLTELEKSFIQSIRL